MIVVTGAAGFIGSAMIWYLNKQGIKDILAVDSIETTSKWLNLRQLHYHNYIHKNEFLELLTTNALDRSVSAIIHMGACSSTTEENMDYLFSNNVAYSQALAKYAVKNKIRFIYASSAATYGNGELGFDDQDNIQVLKPINRYGYSKQFFDVWIENMGWEDKVVGLKFFNVFGPNEYHKDTMRSVVCKAFELIHEKGEMGLFKSYHSDYKDGEQKRDFIYIKDCVKVIDFFLNNPLKNGLFNLGTGKARSWNDLVKAVFKSMQQEARITYIDMPDNLKGAYQYFTEAKMKKLKSVGYSEPFMSLEAAVDDYINGYLSQTNFLASF